MSIRDANNDLKKVSVGTKIHIKNSAIEKGTIVTASDSAFSPRSGEIIGKIGYSTSPGSPAQTESGFQLTSPESYIAEVSSIDKRNLLSTKGKTFTHIDTEMLDKRYWVALSLKSMKGKDYRIVAGTVDEDFVPDRFYPQLTISGIDIFSRDITDPDTILDVWTIS